MQGINIYSGAGGLGSALTNPTEPAFQKGALGQRYPIVFDRRRWPDIETAYQTLKRVDDTQGNDQLMVELFAAKFLQHPELYTQVLEHGGRAFLGQCSHFTQARSDRFRAWEGEGTASRFIRNLIAGFDLAQSGAATVDRQADLF